MAKKSYKAVRNIAATGLLAAKLLTSPVSAAYIEKETKLPDYTKGGHIAVGHMWFYNKEKALKGNYETINLKKGIPGVPKKGTGVNLDAVFYNNSGSLNFGPSMLLTFPYSKDIGGGIGLTTGLSLEPLRGFRIGATARGYAGRFSACIDNKANENSVIDLNGMILGHLKLGSDFSWNLDVEAGVGEVLRHYKDQNNKNLKRTQGYAVLKAGISKPFGLKTYRNVYHRKSKRKNKIPNPLK